MIIGVISGYNDAQFLKACFGGICGVCDYFVYVDGVYTQFPQINASAASSDDSIDIAREWGATIIPSPPNGWKSQIEKRNQYLVGKEGDWYLMVDCDEIFEGHLDFNKTPEADGYNIFVYDVKRSRAPWLRLFRHHPGIEYRGGHNLLWYGERMLNSALCDVMPTARINHRKHLQPESRNKKKQTYYLRQFKSERKFRLSHNCP